MLDLTGLYCPEVVLRVKERVAAMAPGALLEVVSTDPLSRIDVPLFARKAGHALEREWAEGGGFHFLLRVGAISAKAP